jgi:phosphohistidine swiveling domain-containing protein
VLRKTVSPDATSELVDELRRTVAGRTYVNLSASMKLQGKKRVAGEFRAMDALSADILDQIDEAEYLPDKLPRSMKGMMLSAVRGNLGIAWKTVQAIRNASKYRLRYREAEQELRRRLQEDTTQDGTIRAFADRTLDSMMDYFDMAVPTIAAAELAKSRIRSLFKNEATEVQSRFPYLERALPNNVTIEMGLAMLRLARFDEISEYTDGNIFAARLRQRTLSDDLLAAWDAFMDTYGFRSPNEMDPAAPRYYDRPAELFRQLRTLAANTDPKHNPESIYRKAQDERRTAYAQMRAVARHRGKRTARSLEKWYAVLLELGGYRESPKYFFVLITDMLRRRVVAAAQDLVAAGRLDSVQQVFDLTIDELDRGLKDPALDLRALATANAQMMRPYRSVRQFPRLVDSRGKILRLPQREAHEGELAGQPISPGIVRGKTKVLHQADEKPVLPGEILVARATDPGWTPLFINASGIVLEVGGMLQHGALVAREYGKPCVAGVENATTVLSDGQQVELNGHDGTVRLL